MYAVSARFGALSAGGGAVLPLSGGAMGVEIAAAVVVVAVAVAVVAAVAVAVLYTA